MSTSSICDVSRNYNILEKFPDLFTPPVFDKTVPVYSTFYYDGKQDENGQWIKSCKERHIANLHISYAVGESVGCNCGLHGFNGRPGETAMNIGRIANYHNIDHVTIESTKYSADAKPELEDNLKIKPLFELLFVLFICLKKISMDKELKLNKTKIHLYLHSLAARAGTDLALMGKFAGLPIKEFTFADSYFFTGPSIIDGRERGIKVPPDKELLILPDVLTEYNESAIESGSAVEFSTVYRPEYLKRVFSDYDEKFSKALTGNQRVNFIAGKASRYVSLRQSMQVFNLFGHENKQFYEIEGADHWFNKHKSNPPIPVPEFYMAIDEIIEGFATRCRGTT